MSIDELIQRAKDGDASNLEMIRGLWPATLYLVGRGETDDPASFEPVVLKSPSTGEQLFVAYTSVDKIAPSFAQAAPTTLALTGEAVFTSIRGDYGLVINPDAEPTVEFNAPGVPRIVAAMAEDAETTE